MKPLYGKSVNCKSERPPQWSRGNNVASDEAGRVRSPIGPASRLRVFPWLSSTVRQMSGNLGHIRPRVLKKYPYSVSECRPRQRTHVRSPVGSISRGFFLNCKDKMSENLDRIRLRISLDPHNHQKSYSSV